MLKRSRSKYIMISCLAAMFGVATAALPAQRTRAVNLHGASQPLPFSDGIVAGNTLYVSGTQGTTANGQLAEGIAGQTRAALETIRKIVNKAGFHMSDVVDVNVYLSDVHDFSAMNAIYKTFFSGPKPARTTIQAAALVNGAKIEISAIAVK